MLKRFRIKRYVKRSLRQIGRMDLYKQIEIEYHNCPLYVGSHYIGGAVVPKKDGGFILVLGNTFFLYSDKIRRQIINHELSHVIDCEERLINIPVQNLTPEMVHDKSWSCLCFDLFGEVLYSVPATHYPLFSEKTKKLKDYTNIAVPRLGLPIYTLKER